VHNVRRDGKVRQLHLARLGARARITDDLVREVSKKHPFVELNWKALRNQLNGQVDLANPNSPTVQKLVSSLRALNLELADVFPPSSEFLSHPWWHGVACQLRLLQSTVQVKLDQFAGGAGDSAVRTRLRGSLGGSHERLLLISIPASAARIRSIPEPRCGGKSSDRKRVSRRSLICTRCFGPDELARPPGRESTVSWANRLRKDTHRGSGCGDSSW